jgi:regulatory protein
MGKVTAIRAGRSQGRRINIFLDGRFTFSLEAELVLKENLRVGQELSDDQIEILARSDCFQRCLNAAARFLTYRPRSEAELRERLCRRDFDSNSIEAVLKRLKEQGLMDDATFAQSWKNNRESLSPRSRWLTRLELKQKGVAADIIDHVLAAVDDDDAAYQAAMDKLHSLPRADYQSFRRRLGDHLKRRGFSYGVINQTVKRILQEQGEQH